MSVPKTQLQALNFKRTSAHMKQEYRVISQHDDLIKFIYDSWNKVSKEFEHFNQTGGDNVKNLWLCPAKFETFRKGSVHDMMGGHLLIPKDLRVYFRENPITLKYSKQELLLARKSAAPKESIFPQEFANKETK